MTIFRKEIRKITKHKEQTTTNLKQNSKTKWIGIKNGLEVEMNVPYLYGANDAKQKKREHLALSKRINHL